MKIYTRKGDKGQTSLLGRKRVDKDSPRIDAYGTVDELSSTLGIAIPFVVDPVVKQRLEAIQQHLFSLGADLAQASTSEQFRVRSEQSTELESWIDECEAELPRLQNFILPGGSHGASLIHLARTVCRRAERLVVHLGKLEAGVNPAVLVYLNRLSDLLFVLARYENMKAGGDEIIWKGK